MQKRKGNLLHDVPLRPQAVLSARVAAGGTETNYEGLKRENGQTHATRSAGSYAHCGRRCWEAKYEKEDKATQTFSMEGTEKCAKLPEMEVPKKCKVDESVKVSDKEQKIMQVAEICGVELPYVDRSNNFKT